jgi:hypothetical protein
VVEKNRCLHWHSQLNVQSREHFICWGEKCQRSWSL